MRTEQRIFMNDVIILAGGLGTRLSHVVTDTQKVMAPVGGRPFLSLLTDDLIKKGCKRIILAVSYHSEQIKEYFGSRYNGADIIYSEEEIPLGTGGAVKQALRYAQTENVTVINGDTFFNADLNELNKKHIKENADITVCVRKLENITRSGTVTFEQDGKMLSFNERQELSEGYINGGIYIIKKDISDKLPENRHSFEKDVLEKALFNTYCYISDGYFIDMGIPADYFRANTEIPLLFGRNIFPAAFLDRDGVICKEKHHLYKTEDFEFIDGVPEAIEQIREKGYLIVVITNQAGVAKGLYTEEDVRKLHRHMCDSLKDKAFIDAVYYSPWHPEGIVEEYRKDSPERKPGTGMIDKAVKDFAARGITIDIAGSFIVGDTERDIETGINAHLGKKILVRSGHSIPDEKMSKADVIADSLKDAINFIQKPQNTVYTDK